SRGLGDVYKRQNLGMTLQSHRRALPKQLRESFMLKQVNLSPKP
ncbi:MAG: hypothetical protein RIS37_253, partial [Actinomycetota bacterium]